MPLDFDLDQPGHTPIVDAREAAFVVEVSKAVEHLDMKLSWDEGDGCICIGSVKLNNYINWKSEKAFFRNLLDRVAPHCHVSHHPKWSNKAFAALIKGSPKKFYQHYNKMQYKYFVIPYKHIINKVCFAPRIRATALKKIVANKNILQEVYDDGLHNLLPLVAATGKTPQQLKQEYKGVWKELSKNTLHRNKTIVESVCGKDWSKKYAHRNFPDASKMPTTVLEMFSGYGYEVQEHITKHYKGRWSTKNQTTAVNWIDVSYKVTDTKLLANQLEQPFDPKWSPRKMHEKHEEYTQLINARRYSSDKIDWLKDILPCFEYEGYVATLLDNRKAIADEGTTMRHCVGGYAESVACGRYLVYSITKDGERSSTLGVYASKGAEVLLISGDKGKMEKAKFSFNQHYGRFNSPITDKHEKEIGELIVKELNKTL